LEDDAEQEIKKRGLCVVIPYALPEMMVQSGRVEILPIIEKCFIAEVNAKKGQKQAGKQECGEEDCDLFFLGVFFSGAGHAMC
jgi:hypothetical protein